MADENGLEDGDAVTDYITIQRGLDDKGVFVNVVFSDDLHMLEALGMLEFAKMNLIKTFEEE